MPRQKKNLIPLKREREGYFIFDELKAKAFYEPERALLVGILERGIRDMIEPHHKKHIKRATKLWFISDSVGEFSFIWVMRELFPDSSESYKTKLLKYLNDRKK